MFGKNVPLSTVDAVRIGQGNESISSFFEYSDADFLTLIFIYVSKEILCY